MKITEHLERGYKRKDKQVRVDTGHYVDMSETNSFVERRYDDPDTLKSVQRYVFDIHIDEVKWYWATTEDNSWTEYDDASTFKLELGYKQNKKQVPIDDGFVDMNDKEKMILRRLDDNTYIKLIKRETLEKTAPAKKQKLCHEPDHVFTVKKEKKPERMAQLTDYEKEEFAFALDFRLYKFYSSFAGLNDELLENDKLQLDKSKNPEGQEYDLGKDGAFEGYKILIGQFFPFALDEVKKALEKKGFKVVVVGKEIDFINVISSVDVAWIISGKSVMKANEFTKAVLDFHKNGGALFLWGENRPYYAHINLILPSFAENQSAILYGDTPGNKVMKIGEANKTGEFGPHLITTGILNLYEGITISYPKELGKMKVLAKSSNGHPAICYLDHEVLKDKNYGRVVVDTAFSKLNSFWEVAGFLRYAVNASVWLLGLEHKLMNGIEIIPRNKKI